MVKELNISDSKKENSMKEKVTVESTPVVEGNTVLKSKKKVNIKEFVSKHKVKILLTFAVLILSGILAFFYFGIYKVKDYTKPSELINLGEEYLVSLAVDTLPVKLPIPSPTQPRTEVSAINGLLFTKDEIEELESRRPIAVMINNHEAARPQSGLNSADIVYEALVESGITRYLAIFWSETPKKVGPIRSARQYYLEWLSPYDPLYIYDGCASSSDDRVDACGNIYAYKLKSIATIGAWRWNDGRRYAPHNEYSSLITAWEYAEDRNWDSMPKIDPWKFKKDLGIDDRGEKSKIAVTFHSRLVNGGAYNVVWTYDSKSNSYFKETGGKKDIDQETNTQVYAKNLVIQETKYTATNDEKGRIILDTIGEGKATYLIDGKITSGTWKKESRTERTVFYDSSGFEVQFNRGRIWITVISRSVGKFDIIEQ